MLKPIRGVAVAFVLLGTAGAQAEFRYSGYLNVSAATTACTKGPKVGTDYAADYHPMTVSGGTQDWQGTALNLRGNFVAWSWRTDGNDFPVGSFLTVANSKLTDALYSSDNNNTTFVTQKVSKIKLTAQSPSVIAAGTDVVTLSGQVLNPLGLAGQETCKITFQFISSAEQ